MQVKTHLNKIGIVAALVSVHCLAANAQQKTSSAIEADKLLLFPPDCYQLTRERKYSEALAAANKLVASQPNDADALTLKAYLLLRLNKPNESIKVTTSLLAKKKRVTDAHMLRGIAYLDLHDYFNAIEDLSATISLCPERPNTYQLRAQAYKAIGRKELADTDNQAFACLKEVHGAWEAFVPGEVLKPFGHINQSPSDATAEYAAGQKAFNRKDYPTAIQYFSHVISLRPNFKAAYYYRAAAYEPLESRDKAVADLTKVVGDGSALFQLPICVSDDAKKRPISDWYRIPIMANEPLTRRSRCYFGLQKYESALSDATQAIKIQPEDRYAIEIRGNVLSAMRRYREAIKEFEKCEKLDAEYAGGGYKLVRCFRELHDYKNAVRRLSWLLRSSPNDDVLYLERADALSKLGFHQESITDLNKVIERTPELRDGYVRRAEELEIMGEYHTAINDLTKAIELDSTKAKTVWMKRQSLLEKLKLMKSTEAGAPPIGQPAKRKP